MTLPNLTLARAAFLKWRAAKKIKVAKPLTEKQRERVRTEERKAKTTKGKA